MEIIHISWAKIYKYKSLIIDWHEYCGPAFLRRKDYKPKDMSRISLRQWGEFNQWLRLSEVEREKYSLL